MSGIADLIEQKKAEKQRLTDEIREAGKRRDKLDARRDKLTAEIAELEAFLAWQAQQP